VIAEVSSVASDAHAVPGPTEAPVAGDDSHISGCRAIALSGLLPGTAPVLRPVIAGV
jgi:hypothetical protein